MKQSHKLSDALHILSYIALNQEEMTKISSQTIADSVGTNPGLVRRLMSNLSKAGLLLTKVGTAKPQLAKEPKDISFYDVFEAVEGDGLLKVDEGTNPDCAIGNSVPRVLPGFYQRITQAAFNEMRAISLQDMLDELEASLKV